MAAGNPRFATRARRWLAGAVLAAVAELAAGPAGALSITLAPATVAPLPGGAFALDLVVSDLGGAALGAYDVALTFDPTAVALTSVSFDGYLGVIPDEASAEALTAPGSVALASFSILPEAALDALQPDSFRLASLVFTATSGAPSTIAVGSALLGDAQGRRLTVDVLGSATIAPVPEPAAALAFGVGVMLAARASRRRARPRAACGR